LKADNEEKLTLGGKRSTHVYNCTNEKVAMNFLRTTTYTLVYNTILPFI